MALQWNLRILGISTLFFDVYFQLHDREKPKETKSRRGINVASQPSGGM